MEGLTSALTLPGAARASIWATARARRSQRQQHNNSLLSPRLLWATSPGPRVGLHCLTPHSPRLRELSRPAAPLRR